ncbi:MAG TPA: aminotransferase class IV, partial [Alphaproteobacteria bacterium]|nr:aminotransferase class IV [Alphaproteobacteria bacterium]
MPSIVYLNGQFLPKSEAKISVEDRGFLFGDGVYEVTRAVNGKLFEWKLHAQRLQKSLKEMRLLPAVTVDELEKLQLQLLLQNGLSGVDAYVYLEITRGAAPRSHAFPAGDTPCTIYM